MVEEEEEFYEHDQDDGSIRWDNVEGGDGVGGRGGSGSSDGAGGRSNGRVEVLSKGSGGRNESGNNEGGRTDQTSYDDCERLREGGGQGGRGGGKAGIGGVDNHGFNGQTEIRLHRTETAL